MDNFEYERIDIEESAIRMLRLCKGVGSNIECELFEVWLNSNDLIPYEALSYTWGCMEMSASVQVNGKVLGITENLYLALLYLRSNEHDRILWVDAVCINQADHRERVHQVGQMSTIYSLADQVIIWLGPATDDTNLLLDSLKRLEEESAKINTKGWSLVDQRWINLWSSLQLSLSSQFWNLASRQRKGLDCLLQHSWFTRTWILQEVANARKAIICHGAKALSTRIFVLAPLLTCTTPEPHCQAVMDIMPSPFGRDTWWGQNRDLYTLLMKFRKSKASDPRDMIYALLGICSNAQDAKSLHVDYTKELQQLVRDAAAFLFGVSDCSYCTVSELMNDVTFLNTIALKRMVESDDVNSVAAFLRQRADAVEITKGVVETVAANAQSGPALMKLLYKEIGKEVAIVSALSGLEVMRLLARQVGRNEVVTEDIFNAAKKREEAQSDEVIMWRRGYGLLITKDEFEDFAGGKKAVKDLRATLAKENRLRYIEGADPWNALIDLIK